jgi:hypothetical protein
MVARRQELAVTTVAAAAGVVAHELPLLIGVLVFGPPTRTPTDCTMERVAECAMKEVPAVATDLMSLGMALFVVTPALFVAGLALLAAALIRRRPRGSPPVTPRPLLRLGCGTFFVTTAVACPIWLFFLT